MKRLAQEIHQRSLWQVLVSYAAVSWVVLEVTGTLVEQLGLPGWVFPSALTILLVGLPVVLATTYYHKRSDRRFAAGSEEEGRPELGAAIARNHHRVFRWRNVLAVGGGAFLVLFGFAGLYVVIQDRGQSLGSSEVNAIEADPGVAFLPFAVSGPVLQEADLRESLVTLLPMALDGIEGIRPISSMTLWARWRDEVPEGYDPDLQTALSVAEETGARYAVVGTGVSLGLNVRLAADIYEVPDGVLIDQVTVEGPPDSLLRLVDRFAVETLRTIGGVTEGELARIDLAPVITESPEALREFLRGQAAYRRADWTTALAHLDKALEADSTFGAAHYRKAMTIGWAPPFPGKYDVMDRHWTEALRYTKSERIVTAIRGQMMITGLSRSVTVGELERVHRDLVRAVQRYPDDAELWTALAELYFHNHSVGVFEDPIPQAENALLRAMTRNPDAAADRVHLVELAFWRADSALARERLEEISRLAPGSDDDRTNRIMWRMVFQGRPEPGELEAAVDTLESFGTLATIYNLYPVHHSAWPIAEALIRRSQGAYPGWYDCLRFQRSLGAGRWRYFMEEAERVESPVSKAYCLSEAYLQGIEVSGFDSAAAAAADANSYFVGWLAADRGDWTSLEITLEGLRESATASLAAGDTARAAEVEDWTKVLEAYGEWKQGDPDPLIRALESLPPSERADWSGWDGSRWWLGMLYLENDRPADAIRTFKTFWGWRRWPIAKYHIGQAYEQLGDLRKARESYAALVEAWEDADPELQPWVERGRDALVRLGPLDQ